MRIRIASDLHFEFHADGGLRLALELAEDPNYDVLVVAGDLASYGCLEPSLRHLVTATKDKPIVYVLGNHEPYGGSWEKAVRTARRVAAAQPRLHVLEQETVTIEGQRFVGCTLWYPHEPYPGPLDSSIGDFYHIENVYGFLGQTATASARFLQRTVQTGDVVVTHHLPHPRSNHPKFAGSKLTPFFLHNVSPVVETQGAALWIHGHTHEPCDYVAGTTRVVCNPFGYARNMPGEPNPRFSSALTLPLP